MTSDSTSLTSIRPLAAPITIQTADGTSLSVAGLGTLSNSSFHIPVVSHVPKLTIQLISASQAPRDAVSHGGEGQYQPESPCVDPEHNKYQNRE